MSRVGKKLIEVNPGIDIKIDGQDVRVKGPKGELHASLPSEIRIERMENILRLIPKEAKEGKRINALHGLSRSLLDNMVQGVTNGFRKELKIIGIGYRANVSGKTLNLFIGYSHPIKYNIPDKIKIEVTKDNRIIIEGINKQVVGQVAAEIRDLKRPEPYKGKGIMYTDERIRRKVGKAGA